MEIKATLNKPYTEDERMDFIVKYNHGLGYTIEEVEDGLQALGYTEAELTEMEQKRIAMLSLTRGDVFRGLLQAKGVTRAQIRTMIETREGLSELEREMALIDFDEALNFYRGNSMIEIIGEALGITSGQLDEFFESGDYKKLGGEF